MPVDIYEVFEKKEPVKTNPIDVYKQVSPKKEGHWKGWIKPSLDEAWEGVKGTPETIFSLANSMALWPISKVAGASKVLAGGTAEEARETERQMGEAWGYQPGTKAGKGATELIGKGFEIGLTPARMAGEGITELVGPRAGYLGELASELFTFKFAHGVGVKAKTEIAARKTAKVNFGKKMSALTKEQRAEVYKITEESTKPRDIVKEEIEFHKTQAEKTYETQKDIWIGKKDRRIMEADIEGRLLQKDIMELSKGRKEFIKYDEAMQIYIDTKRNPSHIEKYYNKLTPEQKKVVDLSQKLPDEIKAVANKIEKSYKDIGLESLDADIIKNVLDHYASRTWDLKGKKGRGERARRFGTTTRHAKQRKFETVLEGQAEGYELKTKAATVNLRNFKEEIIKTIEDKNFLTELRKMKDMDGNPLLTTKHLEGYTRVEHPNFKAWEWAGTTKRGISVTPEFAKKLRVAADKLKDLRVKTEKETTTKTTTEQTFTGAGLAKSGPLAKMESVIKESLMNRGMTEGEAKVYIRKLKSKGADAVKEIAKEVSEKTETTRTTLDTRGIEADIKIPKMTTVETGKTYGKNFFQGKDGALFERRELYAPKKQATNLNNILGISSLYKIPGMKGITKFNDVTKAWILQTSFFHHLAFSRSYYLGTNHKVWREMNIRQAYKEGLKSIEQSDPIIMNGVENGLTLGLKMDWSEPLLREGTFVGKILNKTKATKSVKDAVNGLREVQADFLFGKLGAGLKAKSYMIELRNQMKKYPDENPNITAKRVARLINDDFGGLHLQRLGRNPTLQHILKLVLLAPDWTESNIRTMVKTVAKLKGDKRDLHLYRKFWGGVVVKGLGVTAILNYIMAGGDLDEMINKYEKAWKDGNFNWSKVDITPIYKAFGGQGDDPRYFTMIGHFQDPAKFIAHPIKSAHHKGSVVYGIGHEALQGADWAGRKFTTLEELLETGKTVKWGAGHPISYEQFPAYVLSQLIGTQPIQVQNFTGWMNGEIDGFDAFARSAGLMTTRGYSQRKKTLSTLKGLK